MENLRKPEEIIINGVSLNELLKSHQKWLDYGENAKQLILENADLTYVNLENANLKNAILENANLRYADLNNADLNNANLRYANLNNADLRYANLNNAILRYADLNNADLRYTDLIYTNLGNADLSNANLSDANLSNADLRYTDLRYSNLRYTNLENTNLENADLEGAKFYLTNLYKVKRKDLFEVGNIGSRNDTTHYFIEDNRIVCGCFDDSLENFEEKVKNTYDKNSKEYMEYMIAIDTFKRYKEMYS